jgi:hypothetical protein
VEYHVTVDRSRKHSKIEYRALCCPVYEKKDLADIVDSIYDVLSLSHIAMHWYH